MKYILNLLVLLSVLSFTLNAITQEPLTASLSDLNLNIANCDQTNGPVIIRKLIYVQNPLNEFMAVNYEYYDFPSKTWKDGGKACNVGPLQAVQCPVDLRIALGGKGNGTISENLIRLIGTSPATPDIEYIASFGFQILHVTSAKENQMLSRLSILSIEWEAAEALCKTSGCCGTVEKQKLTNSSTLLTSATTQITTCSLSESYNTLLSAESLIDSIPLSISDCLLYGGGQATTPTPIPSSTPISAPTTPTPTPKATSTPVPTPTTLLQPTPTNTPSSINTPTPQSTPTTPPVVTPPQPGLPCCSSFVVIAVPLLAMLFIHRE